MGKYLEAGKIINTHGIAGQVKLLSWCNTPQLLASLKRLYLREGDVMIPIEIVTASVHKKMVLARIAGIDDFDKAFALKNKVVYCERTDIPMSEGEYFITDLIGLKVINAINGKVYGTLKDVMQHGKQDLYEIDIGDGQNVYVPAVKEFVDKIDLESGIFIKPIEGMFDEI